MSLHCYYQFAILWNSGFSYLRCRAVTFYRYRIAVISLDFKTAAITLEFVSFLIEGSVPALRKRLQLATAVLFLLAGRRPEFAKVCLMAASSVFSSHESSYLMPLM